MVGTSEAGVQNSERAHELMRQAHDSGYRFPEGFNGFRAKLSYQIGMTEAEADLVVRGPHMIEITAPDGVEVNPWVRRELMSMAGHRWHLPYEEADGKHVLTLDPDGDEDPLGQRIGVRNDSYDSSYRVANGRVAQVNRKVGPMRFSIWIQGRVDTGDGRELPNYFTVSYWDAKSGKFQRSDIYTDRYADVDGVWLPFERRIVTADDDGMRSQRLALTDHQLLTAEEAGADAEAPYHHVHQESEAASQPGDE